MSRYLTRMLGVPIRLEQYFTTMSYKGKNINSTTELKDVNLNNVA